MTDSTLAKAPSEASAQTYARLSGTTELGAAAGWSVEAGLCESGLALVVRHAEHGPFQLEIAFTAQGPVIRGSAAALELTTCGKFAAECDSFSVHASQRISLQAPRVEIDAPDALVATAGSVEVQATRDDLRLRANDDVQLLGEKILLNCEREAPLPSWLLPAEQSQALLPRQDHAGELRLDASHAASREPTE